MLPKTSLSRCWNSTLRGFVLAAALCLMVALLPSRQTCFHSGGEHGRAKLHARPSGMRSTPARRAVETDYGLAGSADSSMKGAIRKLLRDFEDGLQDDSARLRAQALRTQWEALAEVEDPVALLEDAQQAVLRANSAFYNAFNSRDIEAMGTLWASDVTKFGPLLFCQDKEDFEGRLCVCTHPNAERLEGRSQIINNWNDLFVSGNLPQLTISEEDVLLTSEDMAVIVCREETSFGGVHHATNTFARSQSGSWHMIGHQAGPVR
eukprot:TRINITY_DN79447_c0_g1_i1.p1 TRINITY_DN79447_c0_g1~~TRINITY_DN79447_c0_g1_i1.p1  ORF type:complete len:282 (-),score=47.50 TRINITY_DN79447_c0_g1_i1:141-932(-)